MVVNQAESGSILLPRNLVSPWRLIPAGWHMCMCVCVCVCSQESQHAESLRGDDAISGEASENQVLNRTSAACTSRHVLHQCAPLHQVCNCAVLLMDGHWFVRRLPYLCVRRILATTTATTMTVTATKITLNRVRTTSRLIAHDTK